MFQTPNQFFLSLKLLRGIVALADQATPAQLQQKLQLGTLLIAELANPMCMYIDTIQKARYLSEIRLYCPSLFKQ